ncbi:hypothetical protein [Kribbella sp. DT2]|uniref:hypothetical protein n=1 Tax=Kribbella sp. DT2 TaxID=3393427 RepID=UPI003CF45259
MTDQLTTIEVDQFSPHPAAKVWRALTEAEVLAFETEKLLRIGWRTGVPKALAKLLDTL